MKVKYSHVRPSWPLSSISSTRKKRILMKSWITFFRSAPVRPTPTPMMAIMTQCCQLEFDQCVLSQNL